MAANENKKKQKSKKKGKTLNLNEFLANDSNGGSSAPGTSYVMASKPVSWGDEMEDQESGDTDSYDFGGPVKAAVDRSALPTAPRAARGPNVDPEKIPNNPPFTAFLGNLPFDVNEEDIESFFRNLTIKNIRLPSDGGRAKGFGYAEFIDRQALIDALTQDEGKLKGRSIKVDLATQNQSGSDRDQWRDSGEDRTLGDWRRSDDSGGRQDDRGGDRGFGGRDRGYGDRDRGYGDRDRGFGGDRGSGYGGDRDRGFGGDRDRGFGDRDRGFSDRDRGFGGRDRGFGDRDRGFRDENRDGDRGSFDRDRFRGGRDDRYGEDRGRGYGGDRDRGFGGRDNRYGDRDRYGGDRDRGRYGDRDRYGGGDRDRYGGNQDRGGFGGDRRGFSDRGSDRDDGRRSFGSGFRDGDRFSDRQDAPRQDSAPRERPKLQLQPRTKPVEKAATENTSRSSSIFGGAKPVDTTAREREIEERLIQQRESEHQKLEEEDERRRQRLSSGGDRGGRQRRESEQSDETRRERKLSSSSGKGVRTVAPPPGVGSARVRRDSHLSDEEVFDEEKEMSKESRVIPAPPPKENIWERRKTAQQPAATSPPSRETKERPHTESHPPKEPEQAKNVEFVPAEPPKENAWARRKQESAAEKKDTQGMTDAERNATDDEKLAERVEGKPGPTSDEGSWRRGPGERGRGRGGVSRGGGAERGRGRGERPHVQKRERERPIPKSIDEMPKFEQKVDKDWSDTNKFSQLMEDEDNM